MIARTPVKISEKEKAIPIKRAHTGQRAEAAAPSLRNVNPRVKITVLPVDPSTAKPEIFQDYTLVVATDLPVGFLNAINSATALNRVPFYAGGAHGLYGFVFADLIKHDFAVERAAPNVPTKPGARETPTRTVVSSTLSDRDGRAMELVTKREEYQPLILTNAAPLPATMRGSARRLRRAPPLLPCLRALWEYESETGGLVPSAASPQNLAAFEQLAKEKAKDLQLPPGLLTDDFIQGFLRNSFAELAPTCAFLGGALAQDVINVIGKREQPIQNLMLFDGEEGRGDVLALVPEVRMGR